MADVNGDDKDDVVGFGNSGVWVARSTGSTFQPMSQWVRGYGYSNGWRVDKYPRFLADIDGDGKKDIVGSGGSVVWVWQADFCFPGEEN